VRAKPFVLCHLGQDLSREFRENVLYIQVGSHPKDIIKRFRYSNPFTVDLDNMLYFTNQNRLEMVIEHLWRPGKFSFCSVAPEFDVFKYLRDYYDADVECKFVNRRAKKRYELWPPIADSNWIHDLLYGLVEDEGF